MSQYVALVAGSIGLGISSIAYYVSYHERYRIQKLRACNKIDIIELQPPSDDKETDTNNEYVVQGIIDSNATLSLDECPKRIQREYKPVYKKVTTVNNLFKCTILQEQRKKSTVVCSEYKSFARVMRDKSNDIRIKQEDSFATQSMYIENLNDSASLDEFGLKKIYEKYEPVGDSAASQALKMQHRALVLDMAKAKNSDGVSSYNFDPVLLGTDVKVEVLCKDDSAFIFGGTYFFQRPDDEHITCSNPYLITLNKNTKQVVKELKGTISIAENFKWFFGIPSVLLVGYGSGIADNFRNGGGR
eukprot:g310.t1